MKIQWDPQRQQFHCEGRVYPALVVSPPELGQSGGRWRRWQGEEVEILFQATLPAGGHTSVRVLPAPGSEVATEHAPGSAEPAGLNSPSAALASGPNWLENEWVRVDVAADGSFTLAR